MIYNDSFWNKLLFSKTEFKTNMINLVNYFNTAPPTIAIPIVNFED